MDEQWLIRHQPWGGMAAENVWLTELLQSEAEEHVIDSYSPPPAAPGVWREQPAQTLLTLAARHPAAQKLSLLQEVRRPAAVCAGELASGAVCRAGPGVTGRGKQRAGPSRSGASGRGGATGQPGLLSPLVSDGEKVINPRLQMQQHLQTLTRQAQHAPRRPPQRLAKHPQRNAGDPSASAELGCRGNRLQLDIAAVSSRALEQFTQRAQPRFRVRPGDMITKPDGIEGQLTLEENDG